MFKEIWSISSSPHVCWSPASPVAVVFDILNGTCDVWDHVIIEAKSLDCFPAYMLPSSEYRRSGRGPVLGHRDLIVTPYIDGEGATIPRTSLT